MLGGGSVANMGFISLYRRDYRFTSYDYVTCINVMSRRIVMVASGVMYDIRASEISPGELVCGTSWLMELGSGFQRERTYVSI